MLHISEQRMVQELGNTETCDVERSIVCEDNAFLHSLSKCGRGELETSAKAKQACIVSRLHAETKNMNFVKIEVI